MANICLLAKEHENKTGIPNYAYELKKNLLAIDQKNKYFNTFDEKSDSYIKMPFIKRGRLGSFIYDKLAAGRALNNYNFDIVHGLGNWVPPFLKKSKKIITIHDTIPYTEPLFIERGTPTKVIYKIFGPYFANKADAIITPSEFSKNEIVKNYKVDSSKITVTYLASALDLKKVKQSDIERVKRKYGITHDYILYVGDVAVVRKNIPRLIDAFAKVRKKGFDGKLFLAGRGNNSRKITNKILENGLSKDVLLPGYVDKKDLPALYSGAKLFVYPSFYEGFGLPPLEAMTYGTPVVCSNATSLPEVVGNAALMFDPFNINQMADYILEVLNSESLQKELSRKGRKRAKLFSWKKTAKKTLEVYESVLKK